MLKNRPGLFASTGATRGFYMQSEDNQVTLCAHCKAEVPEHLVRAEGPSFCCVGCEAVYHALGESGLDGFYQWSELSRTQNSNKPATTDPNYLPREVFTEHALTLEDGSLQTELSLDGVHCAGCVWLVEQMPRFIDGVISATLDLGRARLSVRWKPELLEDPNDVAIWLAKFGYTAHPLRAERVAARSAQERALLRRVGVTWAAAGNIMLLSAAHYAGLTPSSDPLLAKGATWLMLGILTISLLYGADMILRRGWTSIRAASSAALQGEFAPLSMDVPLAVGILIGYGYSAWAAFAGAGELWFDSIGMLIAAITTARWLQQRATRNARQTADQMLAMIPQAARRLTEDGSEDISVDQLTLGDLVEIRAGEVIPVDGTIEYGSAMLHRAVLTGESRPENAGLGDLVEAGTTNLNGVLHVRVQATGDQTRVGALMEWIEQRANARPAIIQRADRFGGWFVLVTLLLALGGGLVWASVAPERAAAIVVATLVVACPCALGMATPLALAIAVARAARQGIFVKNDDTLDELAHIDTIVLDKTGTLTHGQMHTVEVCGDEHAIALAAALERGSNHPIAAAIAAASDHTTGDIEDFEEVIGQGVRARVDGHDVMVGRPDWITEHARDLDNSSAHATRYASVGHTPVCVAVDGVIAATFAIGDTLRPEAVDLAKILREREIDPIILSGDHDSAVKHAARQLGIPASSAHGDTSPEDKRAHIMRLIQQGHRVAMVGDGVNDAAAMQAATVGIAVEGGAQISLVAADIFLTSRGLGGVMQTLDGATKLTRVIQRNLIWALLYNIFGITLALSGMVSPLIAAILMPLSSIGLAIASVTQRTFTQPAPDSAVIAPDDTPRIEVPI